MRVLIVDDDALMRTFVSDLLRRIGIHQIQESTDGKNALVTAIKFQPNVILTDIHMEPMDGIEFVKRLRELPNPVVAKIKVIVMTSDTSKETLQDALPLGIKGYIIKPPTLDALKAKIELAMK